MYINIILIFDIYSDNFLYSLLSNILTNGEVIGYIQDEIDRLEAEKQKLAEEEEAPQVEGNEEESFLVAISDYVVWGEPYDCMQGIGSYELALSDEKGNLIMFRKFSLLVL